MSLGEYTYADICLIQAADVVEGGRECFLKKGVLWKLGGVGHSLGARLLSVVATVASIVEGIVMTLIQFARSVLQVIMGGGVHQLERIGTSIGAVAARAVCMPAVSALSIIVPEVTLGVFHLDEKMTYLGIIDAVQRLWCHQSSRLAKFVSHDDRTIRKEVTERAYKDFQKDKGCVSRGLLVHNVSEAFLEVLKARRYGKQRGDGSGYSLKERIKLLYTVDRDTNASDEPHLFPKYVGARKISLLADLPEGTALRDDIAWKLALFDTLSEDDIGCRESSYCGSITLKTSDEVEPRYFYSDYYDHDAMGLVDVKKRLDLLSAEDKQEIRSLLVPSRGLARQLSPEQFDFLASFNRLFASFKNHVHRGIGKTLWSAKSEKDLSLPRGV